MADGPQGQADRRRAARHLLQRPLCCLEHDPDVFKLIRRHETELDRWFTQRLGYRLHVDADTARLFKSGYVPMHRPLRTGTGRPFHQGEYVLLSLVLASTAAGPSVISLRDLVDQVRSAAAECGIVLANDSAERRALVAALRWMVDQGLAVELHAHVDAYAADVEADAILKVRPDRIALLPLAALVGATTSADLFERAERRHAARQWMRCRLVEDPVLYRSDLVESEWGELRRRLGEEDRILGEMFGITLEARAEGVAAVDPSGALADQRFPTGGTVGHASLLLIERLRPIAGPVNSDGGGTLGTVTVPWSTVVAHLTELVEAHRRHWANEFVIAPERLAHRCIDLLEPLRLVERGPEAGPTGMAPGVGGPSYESIVLLPAIARFLAVESTPKPDAPLPQEALW